MTVAPPTRLDIEKAAARLAGRIRTTPIIELAAADLGVDASLSPVTLKLEHLQQSGTFKGRGAMHALLCSEAAADGVVAASGGNHGVAVAWAAGELGMPAHIFVPHVSAPAKVALLRRYGAHVHQVGSEYSESLEASQAFIADHDVVTVHAYDQFEVMAGAGTLAREIDLQTECDTIVVACGGGGLAGGTASWFGTAVRLVLVETRLTPTYATARARGGPSDVRVSGVGADALGARRLGDLGWSALSASSAESVLVDDADVVIARDRLWSSCRLAVEPAGAVALAALQTRPDLFEPDERVLAVVCGANVA